MLYSKMQLFCQCTGDIIIMMSHIHTYVPESAKEIRNLKPTAAPSLGVILAWRSLMKEVVESQGLS